MRAHPTALPRTAKTTTIRLRRPGACRRRDRPGVLAAAERYGASGEAILCGIAAGTETIVPPGSRRADARAKSRLSSTSVFGRNGSAIAVGGDARLNERQIADAMGIVGSMAGGIIEFLPRRLDETAACRLGGAIGDSPALLARGGFVGPRTVFEGTHASSSASPTAANSISRR